MIGEICRADLMEGLRQYDAVDSTAVSRGTITNDFCDTEAKFWAVVYNVRGRHRDCMLWPSAIGRRIFGSQARQKR